MARSNIPKPSIGRDNTSFYGRLADRATTSSACRGRRRGFGSFGSDARRPLRVVCRRSLPARLRSFTSDPMLFVSNECTSHRGPQVLGRRCPSCARSSLLPGAASATALSCGCHNAVQGPRFDLRVTLRRDRGGSRGGGFGDRLWATEILGVRDGPPFSDQKSCLVTRGLEYVPRRSIRQVNAVDAIRQFPSEAHLHDASLRTASEAAKYAAKNYQSASSNSSRAVSCTQTVGFRHISCLDTVRANC